MFCPAGGPPRREHHRVIPDLSVLWVIVIVLVLAAALDRLLFRPLRDVMQAREHAVTSARTLAETASAQARAAAAEFETRTTAARTEVYREMDEKRRAALEEQAGLLARTRQETDAAIADASARLKADAAAAREQLDRDATVLAGAVVERVLGRPAS
jgi:F-type H+-transporting ATPase subunit b